MITRSVLKASKHKERCERTEKSKMFIKDFVSPAFSEIETENKIVSKIIMNYELFEDMFLCGHIFIDYDKAHLWTADVVFDDSYDLNTFTLKYQEDFVDTGSRDFTFDYDKFFGGKKVDHKINKNKYGHDWVKRGTCVAPFVCLKCGALSGSSKAVNLCECDSKKVDNDSKKVDNDSKFLKERTSSWLPYKMEEVSRFSMVNGITLKSAAFYILGRESGFRDGIASI